MSSSFDFSKPNRPLHVGVILMKGVTELLDIAPVDLLSSISQKVDEYPDEVFPRKFKEQSIKIEFHWVNETGETANLTSGLRIVPTDNFDTCPPLDIVVMGAHHMSYEIDEREIAFIRKSYDDCSAFITICGGFSNALRAGLFEGKTVTAPDMWVDLGNKNHPETKWVKKRWQRDGKLWTSGALLNGLDLMRAFGESTFGGEGTLMGHSLDLGAWPVRDVNFADVKPHAAESSI